MGARRRARRRLAVHRPRSRRALERHLRHAYTLLEQTERERDEALHAVETLHEVLIHPATETTRPPLHGDPAIAAALARKRST